MKLHITRDQGKGMMGGVRFQLEAKVDLTPQEAELVKRYRADKEALLQTEMTIFGKKLEFDLKIEDLVKGRNFQCKDIGDILATEENVKQACSTFKNYIEVMKGFGGRETFEYP
jgi:hypothetical protein